MKPLGRHDSYQIRSAHPVRLWCTVSADLGKLASHAEGVAIAGKAHTHYLPPRPYRRERMSISPFPWIDRYPLAVGIGRDMQVGSRAVGKPGLPERPVAAGIPGKGMGRRATAGAL